MENKSKNAQPKKVLSRNRNKNKNRTLQNRAKERELAKREKAMRLAREVEEAVEELSVDGESLRADVLVVPDENLSYWKYYRWWYAWTRGHYTSDAIGRRG